MRAGPIQQCKCMILNEMKNKIRIKSEYTFRDCKLYINGVHIKISAIGLNSSSDYKYNKDIISKPVLTFEINDFEIEDERTKQFLIDRFGYDKFLNK